MRLGIALVATSVPGILYAVYLLNSSPQHPEE